MRLMLVAVQVTSDRPGDRKSYLRPSVTVCRKSQRTPAFDSRTGAACPPHCAAQIIWARSAPSHYPDMNVPGR